MIIIIAFIIYLVLCVLFFMLVFYRKDPMTEFYKNEAIRIKNELENPKPKSEVQKSVDKLNELIHPMGQFFNQIEESQMHSKWSPLDSLLTAKPKEPEK